MRVAKLSVVATSERPTTRADRAAAGAPLPTDLPGNRAGPVLDALDRATARLTTVVARHVRVLDAPSSLPGWSRVTVLAHLRYVAEAMSRITDAAVAGRAEDMYPGGRDQVRPGTLVRRAGETVEQLVDSLESTARELSARWHGLSASDWDRRMVDRDHGAVALSRFLALRLTEVEVHAADLGLPGLDEWSDTFVQTMLPLRLAWLGNARHRADADPGLNGSWVLTDGATSWLVQADGADVAVGTVERERSSDCRLTGTRRDLLALLLGRPAAIDAVGRPELALGFKAAFPGP
jgi:maleylpyruvate isomerase